ncbi:MAG: hypothetical protein EBU54_13960, partial [Mycobacteriaceae bacterium]|nr:hypothetical protein [Mycobacteriaceae bacterium]
GSVDGSGTEARYSAQGTPIDAAADGRLEAEIGTVMGLLEDAAEEPGAGGVSMSEGIDALPPAARALSASPGISAELIEFAGDYGASPQQLALAALAEEDSYPGPQLVFPGGYGQLTAALAKGMPIRLSTAVTEVSLNDPDRVVVRAGTDTWTARAAIVTVPLGVLKAGAIRFTQPRAVHRKAGTDGTQRRRRRRGCRGADGRPAGRSCRGDAATGVRQPRAHSDRRAGVELVVRRVQPRFVLLHRGRLG